MSTDIEVERRSVVTSTQAIAIERLTSLAPNAVYAVHADAQTAGRGRQQRSWEDPPGTALLVSIAAQGPWPLAALEGLPERVAMLVAELVGEALGVDRQFVAWKAPNDLVVAEAAPTATGAKLAGVLIDAASTDDHVSSVVVGCGVNLLGGAFTTADGRAAAAFDVLRGPGAAPVNVGVTALARQLASGVRALLSAPR